MHSKGSAGCSIRMLQLWYQKEEQQGRGLTHSHFQRNQFSFERKRHKDTGDLIGEITMNEAEKHKMQREGTHQEHDPETEIKCKTF